MRIGQLWRRHRLADRSLLSLLFLTTLTVAVAVMAMLGQARAEADDRARRALADAPAADVALQVSAVRGDDSVTQDDAVTEHAARLLAGVPYQLHRSVSGQPIALHRDAGDEEDTPRAALTSYDNLADHVRVVAGSGPGDADAGGGSGGRIAIFMHAEAADQLGLEPGAALILGDAETGLQARVAGTWLPRDPESAYWVGDVDLAAGDDGVHGPVAIAEEHLAELASQLSVRWRLAVDGDRIAAADVATLRAGITQMQSVLSADARVTAVPVDVSGELSESVHGLDEQLLGGQALAVASVILVALVGLTAMWLVTTLLMSGRQARLALWRARGATMRQLVAWALVDATVVVAPAVLLAVPAAAGLLAALGSDQEPWWRPLGVATVGVVLAVAVCVAGMMVALTLRIAGGPAGEAVQAQGAAPRERWVGVGVGVVVTVAAALAVWQLRRYGSPIVLDAGGRPGLDPVTVAAPALALLAGGVISLVALTLAALLVERVVTRGKGAGLVLPARQISRRVGAYVAPVVLVAVTAGAGTLAAAYVGTSARLQQDLDAVSVGADVAVEFPQTLVRQALPEPPTAARYRDVEGVTSAVVVNAATVDVGDQEIDLLAMPAGQLASVSRAPVQYADLGQVAELLAGNPGWPSGLSLPADAERVEVDVQARLRRSSHRFVTGPVPDPIGLGGVAVRLWLVDADGVLASVELGRVEPEADAAARTRLSGALPVGSGSWTIAAFDLDLDALPDDYEQAYGYEVSVADVDVVQPDGSRTAVDIDESGPWQADLPVNGDSIDWLGSAPSPVGLHLELLFADRGEVLRLMPQVAEPAVGIVLGSQAMEDLGLRVGSGVQLRVRGADVDMTVAGAVPVVPGASDAAAAVIDLPQLASTLLREVRQLPQPSGIWLRVDGDESRTAVGAAAREIAGDDAVVRQGTATAAGSADVVRGGLGILPLAGGAAVVLAAFGCAAAWALLTIQRRSSVAVLRALGMSHSGQAWSRVAEQVVVVVAAAAVGIASGILVAELTVTSLAGATIPAWLAELPVALELPWAPWASYLGVLAATAVAVSAAYGARVRSDARRPPKRGE